jgi:MFS family permease
MQIYFGWYVVAGAFVVLFTVFGCAYSFGTFVEALQLEFDASRASVSLVFSIASFIYFLLGAITGYLADRLGPRRVIGAGAVLLGAGLLLASHAGSLREVYLFYGLGIGLGVGCAYVPSVGTVQGWFTRRRGFASGIAVTGVGLGTLVIPLLAAALIEAFGWRSAFRVLGAGAIAVGCAGALAMVADPARLGLAPENGAPGVARADAATPLGIGAAVRTRAFLHVYLAQLFSCFGMAIPMVHLVPFAEDGGLGRTVAVLGLGVIGLGSTIGRFALGAAADRYGRRQTMAVLFLVLAASYPLWLLPASVWLLIVFAGAFGICYGGFVALLPAVIADYFAGPRLTTLIGLQYTAVAFGMLLGPVLAGYAFDRSGSYAAPMLASAILSVVAAAFVAGAPAAETWQPAPRTAG